MAYADEVQLVSPSPQNDFQFGYRVACSQDGSVVVVGEPLHAGAPGSVYVFYGGSWGTVTTLVASDGTNADGFGESVAVSDDGTVIVVGAYNQAGAGSARGKVYVYDGSSWGTETQLTASDAAGGDYFGHSVSISADGSVVVSGAPNEDGSGTDRGKVYVYDGASWGTETMLTASDTSNSDFFGWSVSCSDDGATVTVGAYTATTSDRGKVYVYSGSSWGTETMLTASDTSSGDLFGYSVSVSGDALVAVAGAPGQNGAGSDRGKVYVYWDGFTPQIYRRL